MNMFATNEARKPSRIGSLAIVSGAVLGIVGPAFSADLPEDYPPYRPTYYRESYNAGYNRCYDCGWQRPVQEVQSPPFLDERPPVSVTVRRAGERHWMQRDYVERRYPPYAERPAYPPYPPYRYPHYYSGPDAESYPGYEPPPRSGRRRFGYGGAYDPPAPAAYEYDSEPHAPPYGYMASSRSPYDFRPAGYEYKPAYEYRPAYEYKPAYENEPSPRPPAAVPGGYYGPGDSE